MVALVPAVIPAVAVGGLLVVLAFETSCGRVWGTPGGSDGKESICHAVGLGSILGQENPLEKGEYSSILAWRAPWTEDRRATVHHVCSDA